MDRRANAGWDRMSAIKKGKGVAAPSPKLLLKAALSYAKYLKWPVIPLHSIINGKCTCNKPNCQSQGKHPRISNWQETATTNQKTIYKWWSQWPYSNIGILTGKDSGFFALDVDSRHNGQDSLELLVSNYGLLPDTVETITGSKGSHYLFKYKESINNKVDLFPGIDIRGQNGFIVVSPSLHISGNQYQWELSSHPLEVSIKDAPNWLINMISQRKERGHQKKSSSYWINLFNNTTEGNRNNAASQLAGHLFRRYVDIRLAEEILHLWNKTKVSPPLETSELNTILNSIAKKELARRRGGNQF